MGKKIKLNSDGNFVMPSRPGQTEYYRMKVEEYLNLWSPLFEKAREVDEFQFILALLRFKGNSDAGWDSFENTISTFKDVFKLTRNARGDLKLNLSLWSYGHIVEASDHYETIFNMVRVSVGEPYSAWPFPNKNIGKKKTREMYPYEKILFIKDYCLTHKITDYSLPFNDVLNKEIRNSVFHSDYSVHGGTVRYRNASGFSQILSASETLNLMNKSIAMHETIRNLIAANRSSFTEPKVILSGPHLAPGIQISIQVVVRKNHGVVAMHELPFGPSAISLGRYVPGDLELIDRGVFLLPRDTREQFNKIMDILPRPIADFFVRIYKWLGK